MPGISISSVAVAGTTQHSAYGSRHATIVYPWHPFFGMTLQISHNRRGKKLKGASNNWLPFRAV